MLDLPLGHARHGYLRQRIARKEVDFARLLVRTCFPADQLAQEEQLVYVKRKGWYVALLLAIVYRQQLDCPRLESRLLSDLAHDRLSRRLIHIGPPPRRSPASCIHDLADQQDAVVTEDDAAHIDFRRRVTELRGVERENLGAV